MGIVFVFDNHQTLVRANNSIEQIKVRISTITQCCHIAYVKHKLHDAIVGVPYISILILCMTLLVKH